MNFAFSHPFISRRANGALPSPLYLGDGLGVSFDVPLETFLAKRLCDRFAASLSDDQLERATPPSAFAAFNSTPLITPFSDNS
jgi:hypothetical protein